MAKKIQLTKNGEDVYPITVPDSIAGLAQVAKTGSYNDLSDRPLPSPLEVFWATIGETSFSDIHSAALAGKLVVGIDEDSYCWRALEIGESVAIFQMFAEDGYVYINSVNSSGWTFGVDRYLPRTDELEKVFIATYGSTTYGAIYDAFSDGKVVLVSRTSTGTTSYYQLSRLQSRGNAYFEFTKVECDDEDGFIDTVRITQSNVWTENSIEISIPTDLSDLSDDSTHRTVTDTEKSTWNAKADIFVAQYGTTTIAQIVAAYNAGKQIIAVTNDDPDYCYYVPSLINPTDRIACFTRVTPDDGFMSAIEVGDNGWSNYDNHILTELYELSDDSTHRLVTDTEKATWNGKYTKPASGIPASDIESGVIPSYGIADANNLGLVRVDKNAGGINKDSNGKLILDSASNAEIEARSTVCALKVSQIDKAVKEGVTNNSITLTSAEQTAAKSWLGVNDASEIFWATYGTTTAAEIDAAVAAGKAAMCRYDGKDYVLCGSASTADYLYFGGVYATNVVWLRVQRSNSSWVVGMNGLQLISNKVNSWQATPDDNHYPSERLVKDSIDAVDKVFWATYGTTTASEIDTAVAAGKVVMLLGTSGNNTIVYRYIGRIYGSSAYDFLSFTASYNNLVYYCRLRSDNNNWDSGTSQNLSSGYIKTSWSATPSNAYIPSEKLTYDAIHPAIATTQPAGGFLPNIVYDLGTLSGNTTFALATPADANIVNHYYWTFDTGSTAPTITWPTGLTWMGGSAPTINASKHYEISVLNGIGVAMEV